MRYITPALTLLLAASVFTGSANADETRSVAITAEDAKITAVLKSELIADKQTKARQINVETRNGVVQLNGFIDSPAAKVEAGRIAASANGVKSVKNNLQVRTDDRSAGTVMDDAGITAKVNAALAGDSRTSALRIDVEAHDGEVQLSGFAKNAAEKTAAAELAAKVAGVKSVKNSLSIR